MNKKMILFIVGQIMKAEGGLMILPMLVGYYYKEYHVNTSFGIPILVLLSVGFILTFKKPKNNAVFAKEGFVSVALAWIVMSIFGAMPFYISGDIPSVADCIFETVSGFTTTGATICTHVEDMTKSCLFWRSFTHWIGGMGVLVFVLAILSNNDSRTMHMMRAECPGPKVGKLVSKSTYTARILYAMYFVLTVIEIILLLCGGMPLFDSLINAFGTAGTGGFASHSESIAFYHSTYVDMVIGIFMLLFGMNFNVFYYLLVRKFALAFKNEELRVYLGIAAFSTIAIAANIYKMYGSVASSLRFSFFQVSSIMTSTGFATADFTKWPTFSQTLLLTLMLVGACAGSTGGGVKVYRAIILFKSGIKEIRYVMNPRSVITVKMDGKPVEPEVTKGVMSYTAICIFIMIISLLALTFDQYSIEETASAVITCINNIGPGIGRLGPCGSFAGFTDISKYILSLDMLIGRLEIYPVALLFTIFKR